MPDFDMKFTDHKPFDDWMNLYYGEEDKYTFQYSLYYPDTPDNGGKRCLSPLESLSSPLL